MVVIDLQGRGVRVRVRKTLDNIIEMKKYVETFRAVSNGYNIYRKFVPVVRLGGLAPARPIISSCKKRPDTRRRTPREKQASDGKRPLCSTVSTPQTATETDISKLQHNLRLLLLCFC